MSAVAKWAGALIVVTLVSACSEQAPVTTVPGVSQQLALARAKLLSNIAYTLRFDIPAEQDSPVLATAELFFDLADNSVPLQLDYRNDPASISSLRINGAATDVEWVNEHIIVPAPQLRPDQNRIEIDFVAGNSSLNRNPDFLYTLLVPDRARTVFPLFDQPDLKATFELALAVPAHWQVLANAPLDTLIGLSDGRREYRFLPTSPISSYLFSFVAGKFQSISRTVNGREMTMLYRDTDPARLARNVDAIFDLHGQSLTWLEDYTGIDYPFQKFDFVLIPGFPYSGMEHVGAIQYRASHLLLDDKAPLTDQLKRAQLIAHETAHMWFGNLVTMHWFDDVWTKEVFANFMADKIVNPAFPEVDHALNFQLSHYPAAYAVDRSEGANPIRQPLLNLNQAGQLYGYIIYHKAPIMMRQLELVLGEKGLRDGLAEYLQRFSYGNATWPELIAILDERTDIDLAAWSEVWVNSPGRPEFRFLSAAAAGTGVDQLLQQDPAGEGRVWPQQFELLDLAPESGHRTMVMAVTDTTEMPSSGSGNSPSTTLFNADGKGYGLFPASPEIFSAWDRLGPVQKGSALIVTYEQLLADSDLDAVQYQARLLDIVQIEQDSLLLKLALDQLQFIHGHLLPETERSAMAQILEEVLWNAALAQPDSSRTKLVFRYFTALASSPARVQQLLDIWSGELEVDSLILEEDDYITLAEILAIRLPSKAGDIVSRQLADIGNPDNYRRLEFIAPSLSADEAVRDAFFETLRDEKNRRTESWVIDALANLHHPSRLAHSEKYVLPSLELLEEIQITGDIFFPRNWSEATLGNHYSAAAAQTVRDFLARRPDYNPQLRMKILQAADGLFRASARLQRAKLRTEEID